MLRLRIRSRSRSLSLALAGAACSPPATDAGSLELRAWTSDQDGFHTRSYWVDTGEEVVVFDAQFTPALAETLIADIEAQTDSPIEWLVVTHPNPDKFNGVTAFQAIGASVVASRATAAAIPAVHAYKESFFVSSGAFDPGTYPPAPDLDPAFEDRLELPLRGDGRVVVERLPHPGVSSTQTVARLEDAQGPDRLVVGDLVAGRSHAWLEGGIIDGVASPDLAQWRAALDDLNALDPDGTAWVYPGRGEAMPRGEAVDEQVHYLRVVEDIVRDVLAAYDDPATELASDRADAVYREITARAEQAFPDHVHGYLVEYGVYGLAWSLATR